MLLKWPKATVPERLGQVFSVTVSWFVTAVCRQAPLRSEAALRWPPGPYGKSASYPAVVEVSEKKRMLRIG